MGGGSGGALRALGLEQVMASVCVPQWRGCRDTPDRPEGPVLWALRGAVGPAGEKEGKWAEGAGEPRGPPDFGPEGVG